MRIITVTALQEELHARKGDSTYILLDVRTPEEYAEGHIEGSVNVPLDALDKQLDDLREKETIYVQCRSRGRSARALSFLKDVGLAADLVNVDGGIVAWEAAGFPVVT